jgi:sporulation protein YlmC with PRC-barrel domain
MDLLVQLLGAEVNMLKRLRDLEDWTVVGCDGENVGEIEDFFVDDERWVIRYLSVDTGGWLTDEPVVVSPIAVDRVDADDRRIHVDLTREQVRNAPRLEQNTPISRGWESAYSGYYGYPEYWLGPFAWGVFPVPTRVAGLAPGAEPVAADEFDGAGHLRSISEITGYHIQALDGEIGHVDDFMAEVESWSVRYLVIDTSNWLGGKWVTISPEWVRRVDWKDRLIYIDLTRHRIKGSPQYDPSLEMTRDYEEQLYGHYRRSGYWN